MHFPHIIPQPTHMDTHKKRRRFISTPNTYNKKSKRGGEKSKKRGGKLKRGGRRKVKKGRRKIKKWKRKVKKEGREKRGTFSSQRREKKSDKN